MENLRLPSPARQPTMSALARLLPALVLGAAGSALGQTAAPVVPAPVIAQAQALAREGASVLAPPGARIETEAGVLDPRLRLAPCTRVEVEPTPGAPAWGRTRVTLRCAVGERPWQVQLPVTVRVLSPAWVAKATLPAGLLLAPEHLELTLVDWAAAPGTPFALADAAALQGRVLQRALSAGQAPRAADLQQRRWFAAGELVRVVVRGPGFAAVAQGQALTDGIEGRLARVRTEGGRVLTGMPVAEQQLQVAM
jgi:flagella basal body P-ring formation protein FlgA